MMQEEKRGRPRKGDTSRKRETQPLEVGACTCGVQRATVGEDHNKGCPLYRQRGSGVPVFPHDSIHVRRGRG